MLKMGNPESLMHIGSLRRIPGSEDLIRHIEDFDFDQAVETLQQLYPLINKSDQ